VKRSEYRVWWKKPKGKSQLGRPRRKWENNIKLDLQEVGYGGKEWNDLA
jgi:hypothetical protein